MQFFGTIDVLQSQNETKSSCQHGNDPRKLFVMLFSYEYDIQFSYTIKQISSAHIYSKTKLFCDFIQVECSDKLLFNS